VTRTHRGFATGALADAKPIGRQPDEALPRPLLTWSSRTRNLVAVLVLVAMLPNLALGAMFLLGVVNTPWSAPESSPPRTSPKPALPPAVLSAPAVLEVTAGEDAIFPIALDGTDGVPARSIIAISGLPHGSALSSGRPYGETEWNLKTDEIGDLHLVLSRETSGDAKLTIKLVGPDGAIITDTGLVLKINPSTRAELTETQVSHEQTEARGTKDERRASVDVPTPPKDPVPLPTRRPARATSSDANWIKPLAFVNLREGPSPSARVVSVVAKGAKLRVISRKGRWVQVTHSSTSKSGWIYAGNVATGAD
jgi:hypothetical protein